MHAHTPAGLRGCAAGSEVKLLWCVSVVASLRAVLWGLLRGLESGDGDDAAGLDAAFGACFIIAVGSGRERMIWSVGACVRFSQDCLTLTLTGLCRPTHRIDSLLKSQQTAHALDHSQKLR